ncbi:two-component regulator propeller domain-containing protein [Bacteroides reticulotermitis]|uniref:two-component regulator propeller domain-containing protein n=1 Tax=Bacteroides reticulotermitis TaxID=1133319 RepID=UPI003A885DE3
MYNLIRHIISLLFLVLTLSTYASSYSFRGLSETDGLSDLTVSALYKDSLGYLWIGTATSIERFDGFRFKHYPIFGDNEKLKWVNVITETVGNQLWVGNDMGLWRVNKEQNKLDPFAPDIIKCGVRALLTDSEGTLYVGSENGLFVNRHNQLKRIAINPDILSPDNFIVDLGRGEANTLWILTRSQLYSMNLSTRKITLCPYDGKHKPDYTYRKIARIGSKLYLGTMEHGVIVYDIPTGQFSDSGIDLGSYIISALSSDGKDLLYVGTDGNGVHFVSVKEQQIIRSFRYEPGTSGGIRSNSVYSLLVDREGLMWVGFYQLGLDYTLYQSGLFSTYAYPPSFDSKEMPVRAISINDHERLIGSRNGLFYVDERAKRFKSFKSPQLRSNMIMCIYPFQGKYYIGTYGGGMYVLEPSTLSIRDFDSSQSTPFLKGHVFCVKADSEGCLWIATSMGLYRYKDGKQLNHYTNSNSKLPEGNVFDICFDSTGKGWICTANGLCIWDPSTRSLKADVFPEGFIHKEKVRTVYEGSDHELYFLPDKGPIFISDLSMTNFRRFQPGTPLEGKDAMFMIEDREEWLWIGTNLGLYRYDKKSTFVPYNFVDGLPSSIFITCFPVIDSFGTIWFGNSKGLIYLTRDLRDEKGNNAYPLAITDVYVNGKEAFYPIVQKEGKDYKVSLEPSHKNLTICFSGFTYSDPVYMSYEYCMEGLDEGWQRLSGKSELTYYDLTPGKYQFKLRRIGEPESEISLSVVVASPFNAALWIIVLLLIVIACLGIAYYRKRTKQQLATDLAEASKSVVEEKYRKSNMSKEECRKLAAQLDALMQEKRLYINPDLKIADLATMLNISPYTLSYVFNQFLDKSYYDYLNDYRIAEFKRLINEDEYAKYTLTALAELCGFSSRTSFFRYFKKETGITPNEYIRSIGRTNEE